MTLVHIILYRHAYIFSRASGIVVLEKVVGQASASVLITGLAFSSVNSDYLFYREWIMRSYAKSHLHVQFAVTLIPYVAVARDCKKSFSFRGDSTWLGFSKALYSLVSSLCLGRDVVGGWCDSGSIFVADVVAKWT
ncbi:hypothetical protein ACFE04_008999 [Oxalis oulophora]